MALLEPSERGDEEATKQFREHLQRVMQSDPVYPLMEDTEVGRATSALWQELTRALHTPFAVGHGTGPNVLVLRGVTRPDLVAAVVQSEGGVGAYGSAVSEYYDRAWFPRYRNSGA